ncbi:MAG: S49 family peptidase, partial [Duncaniella sp.]|nr:S49 family peptidase [Duncaniella sp.]
MKKFLLAFLGTLAGIWLSLLIIFVGLTLIFLAVGVTTLQGSKSVQVKSDSYLELTLAGEITDRPGRLDPVGVLRGVDNRTQGLNEIVGAIRAAANDDRINGIVLDCRGSQLGLAGRESIVEALKSFKSDAPTKWIYSYADIYTQGDYYIATAADSVFINPIGQIEISGLSTTEFYFKKLLDNLGVDVQVVRVGTYKSAVEPYTLEGISAPSREQYELILNNMWQDIASQMAEGRRVSLDTVNAWASASTYAMPTEGYVVAKIADRMM